MHDNEEIPPEIALLLEKRETPDRRQAASPEATAEGTTPDNSAPPKNFVERRRGDRRKPQDM
jgi:hypothetical protein